MHTPIDVTCQHDIGSVHYLCEGNGGPGGVVSFVLLGRDRGYVTLSGKEGSE